MTEFDDIAPILGEADQALAAGDHASAEQALRRALRVQEARLGLVHPDVTNTLNDLGVVCSALGRPDEAEFLYRRALGIARRTLPSDHPSIATSLQRLADLYGAQGEPEKLARVADGRSPRSGLPELDALGLEADADDSDGSLVPETSPDPVSPVVVPPPTHASPAGTHASSGRSPVLGRPVALMAGAAVVLVSGVWLLVGGNTGVEAPGPDTSGEERVGAEVVLQAAADEGSAEPTDPRGESESASPEPTGEAVSAAGEPSPAPDTPSTAVAAGRGRSPDVPETSGSGVVVEAAVCRDLVTRGDDGSALAEWRCQPVAERADPGQLFFYTRIRSRTSTTVAHRWSRNGALAHTIDLDIEANDGPGYRTYSFRTIAPSEDGAWRVELLSSGGDLLHVEEFAVP